MVALNIPKHYIAIAVVITTSSRSSPITGRLIARKKDINLNKQQDHTHIYIYI